MKKEQQPALLDIITEQTIKHILTKGISIQGKENIPKNGPAILAMNHMGWLEYFIALLALKEKIFHQKEVATIIKIETLENPVLGGIARKMNVIPIQRGVSDIAAMTTVIDQLVNGKIIFTFIEGTRGTKEEGNRNILKPGKEGTALMAQKAANILEKPIPIYPCAICGGTETVFPEIDRSSLPWRKKLEFERQEVFVTFAPPIMVTSQKPINRERIKTYTTATMTALSASLPIQYRGAYPL